MKGFTWIDYRDLIITVHQHPAVPLIWCWDNLNVHLTPQLTGEQGLAAHLPAARVRD